MEQLIKVRWLISLEAIAAAVLIYCAVVATDFRYRGMVAGFDEAYDTESHMRYFVWRLRAREAFLFVALMWITTVIYSIYKRVQAGSGPVSLGESTLRLADITLLTLPLAGLAVALTFGLDLGL